MRTFNSPWSRFLSFGEVVELTVARSDPFCGGHTHVRTRSSAVYSRWTEIKYLSTSPWSCPGSRLRPKELHVSPVPSGPVQNSGRQRASCGKFEGTCGFGSVSRRSAYAISTDLRKAQRLVCGDFSAIRRPGIGFRTFDLRWKADATQNILETRIRS